MRPEAEPWWRQAQADLDTAQQTIPLSRYYAASWFAQQAAEKGLKAPFLEQRMTIPPRTHDLEFLGRAVSVPAPVMDDLVLLNPAFGLARYPDPTSLYAPVDTITDALAREHVAAAERIMRWLARQLSTKSSQH